MAFSKRVSGAAVAGAGGSVRLVGSQAFVTTARLDTAMCAPSAATGDNDTRLPVWATSFCSRFSFATHLFPIETRMPLARAAFHVFQAQVFDL
jgi:hypothetical protein